MSDFILMHGPALDGSGRIKEQDVHRNNVAAFKAAGWKEGTNPDKEWSNEPQTCYTLEDSIAQAETKPQAKKGRKR